MSKRIAELRSGTGAHEHFKFVKMQMFKNKLEELFGVEILDTPETFDSDVHGGKFTVYQLLLNTPRGKWGLYAQNDTGIWYQDLSSSREERYTADLLLCMLANEEYVKLLNETVKLRPDITAEWKRGMRHTNSFVFTPKVTSLLDEIFTKQFGTTTAPETTLVKAPKTACATATVATAKKKAYPARVNFQDADKVLYAFLKQQNIAVEAQNKNWVCETLAQEHGVNKHQFTSIYDAVKAKLANDNAEREQEFERLKAIEEKYNKMVETLNTLKHLN